MKNILKLANGKQLEITDIKYEGDTVKITTCEDKTPTELAQIFNSKPAINHMEVYEEGTLKSVILKFSVLQNIELNMKTLNEYIITLMKEKDNTIQRITEAESKVMRQEQRLNNTNQSLNQTNQNLAKTDNQVGVHNTQLEQNNADIAYLTIMVEG